jgi:hypothetical protein
MLDRLRYTNKPVTKPALSNKQTIQKMRHSERSEESKQDSSAFSLRMTEGDVL